MHHVMDGDAGPQRPGVAAASPATEQAAADEVVTASGLVSWSIARFVLTTAATLLVMALGPTLLGCRSVVVVSGSMSPNVLVGDILAVRPLGDGPPQQGQVLLVDDPAHPGRLVSHRLIRFNDDGTLQLRGDANAQPDSTPVPRSAVRGVAVLRVPLIGWPAVWAQRPAPLHLALTALVVMGAGVRGLRRVPANPPAPVVALRTGRQVQPGSRWRPRLVLRTGARTRRPRRRSHPSHWWLLDG
jgi:signal peptidase I